MAQHFTCDRCGLPSSQGTRLRVDVDVAGWKQADRLVPGTTGVMGDTLTVVVDVKVTGTERHFGENTDLDLCGDCQADVLDQLASMLRTR